MVKSIFIYLSFLLVLASCNTSEVNKLNSEIYNDIFPEIINSCQDYRTLILPSPEQLEKFKKTGILPQKNNRDKRKLLIVINDSINPLQIESRTETINKQKTALDFEKFPYKSNKIMLVREQDYILNKENLRKKYYYSGHLYLSSIFLTKSLDEGYLKIDFICGKLCSVSTKIIIKKINKKWVISEYINLSIS